MKRIVKRLICIMFLMLVILVSWKLLSHILSNRPGDDPDRNLDMRAVWVSYLELADFKDHSGGTEKEFRQFAERVVSRSKEMGFTCIIFQVRPFGDALYESDLFPWSSVISSSQGRSPGYDPLAIMIETCKKYRMRIEAWVNPYRIGTDSMKLSEDNSARKWIKKKSRNVLHYKGMYYYNPSSPEARKLIAKGIEEIASRYDVDGIHLDDYFYPEFDSENVDSEFDAKDYRKEIQKGRIPESLSLSDWRRNNVDMLVARLYRTVKKTDPSLTFGISPNGNPESFQSETGSFANVTRWIKGEGYIDYIMPQIYWGYKNQYAPFDRTVQWWEKTVSGSHVNLYVGLQAYRMGTQEAEEGSAEMEELQNPELLTQQIKSLDKLKNAAGYSVFSYQYLDPDNSCFFFYEDKDKSHRIKTLRKMCDSLDQYLSEQQKSIPTK